MTSHLTHTVAHSTTLSFIYKALGTKHTTSQLKSFVSFGWLLVLGLKKSLVKCVTVCVKSEVILVFYVHKTVDIEALDVHDQANFSVAGQFAY